MVGIGQIGKLVFSRYGAWAVLALGLLYAGWSLRQSTLPEPEPPRIITVYDTVTEIDTVWKTKLIRNTHWDTVFTEKVITQLPETVTVTAVPTIVVNGITQVEVGKHLGDTTRVLGQKITADTNGVYRENWQVNYYTFGPLLALSTDSSPPRIKFGKVVKECNFWCGAEKYVIGAGTVLVILAAKKVLVE